MTTPVPHAPVRRSGFVTVLGGAAIGIGTLLVPVSGCAFLMVLAGGDGTSSSDVGGFLTVVVAPPAALLAGIGLLRRRAWAWWLAGALLLGVIAGNVHALLTWRPAPTIRRSPSGVPTTILASPPNHHSVPIIVVCTLALLGLSRRTVRRELGVGVPRPAPSPPPVAPAADGGDPYSQRSAPPPGSGGDARGWRVGHRGRDALYYEERHGLGWRRIEIDGEMLMGRAHHVIYFASPHRWRHYPAWARDRRDEIIARVQSALRPPDYEYGEVGGDPPAAGARPPSPPAATARQRAALLGAVALLLAIGGGMGWIVARSLERDATWWPARRATQQRVVSRADEPASFWLAIAVYAGIGVGCGGLALWGLLHAGRRG